LFLIKSQEPFSTLKFHCSQIYTEKTKQQNYQKILSKEIIQFAWDPYHIKVTTDLSNYIKEINTLRHFRNTSFKHPIVIFSIMFYRALMSKKLLFSSTATNGEGRGIQLLTTQKEDLHQLMGPSS
jgi:hypothetical protein